MTEEQKEKLTKLVGEDGKIIVLDSMPDDLKAAIEYLNDNNIGLFTDIPGKDDPVLSTYNDSEDGDSDSEDSSSSSEEPNSVSSDIDDSIDDSEDSNVDDLDSMF